jgi:hypothetical protein
VAQQDAAITSPSPRGTAVAVLLAGSGHGSEHDRRSLESFVCSLARLKGFENGGEHDPARPAAGPLYFVPNDTLEQAQAAALGIRGPQDLFGGVVPHAFVATKVISHALVDPTAACPAGWNPDLAREAGDAVLTGYAAFSREDARAAGLRLLQAGPVRIKPVLATGGHGQSVAREAAALQAQLDRIDPREIETHGLVLEEHLEEVRTFSVGRIEVGDMVASYWGTQRLTRNNAGENVFGGSDLTVVRGDFDALLAQQPPPEQRQAVELARRFDAAARACYPGLYASRTNYDVALGRDAQGRWRAGVLEQSWRVGGATGPELAALEAMQREPQRVRVHAAGLEIYGDSPEPPAHATVHFRGTDPRVGLLTKYTVIDPDVHPR